MNYLPDAALFLGLIVALVIAGWCLSAPARDTFEAAFVPGAALLGFYAWLIWIIGSLWRLVPAFWCILPWPLLAITVVLKRRNLAHHARRTRAALRNLSSSDRALALYLGALFALTFVLCLAPPGGADYDSLTYHLAVPAQYLRAGRVIELRYDTHSYFPMSLEMLYVLGLWARGAVLAKLFHWLMLPLGALAIIALGRRAGSARGGLLGAALYASSPLILQESTTAYIDLGFAAFSLLAILCAIAALQTRAHTETLPIETSPDEVSPLHDSPNETLSSREAPHRANQSEIAARETPNRAVPSEVVSHPAIGSTAQHSPIAARESAGHETQSGATAPGANVPGANVPGANASLDFALCGAFCGFSLGTKYFGALIFGFLGLWLLFSRRLNAKNRGSVDDAVSTAKPGRDLALFAVPALLFGAVWYARNVLWTGNPVYPFAYGVFGGAGWTAQMARDYDASQAIYGFGKTPLDALWLPLRLALAPLNYNSPFFPLANLPAEKGLTGAFEVQGLLLTSFPGPAILALGVPSLLLGKKPRAVALASAFFGFLLLFWFVSSQQIRYLIPALALLSLIGGWGAMQMAPRLRLARWVGGAFLALWFVWAPGWLTNSNRGAFGVISGAQTPRDYLHRAFSGFDAMDYANKNLPKDAKFAVYGESRCFYLDRDYFWADDPHNNLIDYAQIHSGEDFARALRAQGATYVLANTEFARNGGGFGPPQNLIDEAVAAGKLELVTNKRGYLIFALKD